jgi:hypothetical protein
MFSVEERDLVRTRLLDLAEADPAVVGAAITGSQATDDGDRWSDIDLAFAIDGSLEVVMQCRTRGCITTSLPSITEICRPARPYTGCFCYRGCGCR